MARLQIDKLDTKILQMLVDNGRKPFLEIARECGVSGAAIHQRIAKLQATNILEGSRALIKPTTLGYDTCAFVGIYLKEAASFDEIISKLKTVPEVTEVTTSIFSTSSMTSCSPWGCCAPRLLSLSARYSPAPFP